jgi:hypothetical protein
VLALLADSESWSSSALAPARTRNEPANSSACARLTRSSRQGAFNRSRTCSPVDDAADTGLHEHSVTPRGARD